VLYKTIMSHEAEVLKSSHYWWGWSTLSKGNKYWIVLLAFDLSPHKEALNTSLSPALHFLPPNDIIEPVSFNSNSKVCLARSFLFLSTIASIAGTAKVWETIFRLYFPQRSIVSWTNRSDLLLAYWSASAVAFHAREMSVFEGKLILPLWYSVAKDQYYHTIQQQEVDMIEDIWGAFQGIVWPRYLWFEESC